MANEEITSLDKERLGLSEQDKFDPSKRAEAALDQILKSDSIVPAGPEEERITVEEAIASRPILDHDTGRKKARVLFVTTDETVLQEGTIARKDYVELAKQFDEMHVFCLIPRAGKESFDRADKNLWFYQVRSKNWWTLPWKAKKAAIKALTWNGSFRPDVVIGVDVFEAGLAGYLISKKFRRPLQFHVYTDPFAPDYLKVTDNNWRLRIAKFLLRRAKSIRTQTSALKDSLQKRYRKLTNVGVMPHFYNFSGISSATPTLDLHERYKDFAFIILSFGPMTADSHLHDLFTSLHKMLRNPRIGLVVVGDGPAKSLFTEKVKLLGIEENVVFQKEAEDLPSYLKTADLLVELSTTEEGEVRALQAAAAGLPMVARATELRRDLFKDGESAFLCEPEDLLCISQKVSKYINSAAFRTQLSSNAVSVIRERLHEDREAHYQARALLIESVLTQAVTSAK